MKPVTFHERADAEVTRAVIFYNQEEPGLGLEFIEELDRALTFPRRNPKAFPVIRDGVRRTTMHRFPYCIYYVEQQDKLRVMAVAHDRQRPEYWIDRLGE